MANKQTTKEVAMHFATLSLHDIAIVTLRREKVTAENGKVVEWLAIAITDNKDQTFTVNCYDTPVVDMRCDPVAADEVINYQPSPDVTNVISLIDAVKRTLGDYDAGNHPAPDHWSDHPVPEW